MTFEERVHKGLRRRHRGPPRTGPVLPSCIWVLSSTAMLWSTDECIWNPTANSAGSIAESCFVFDHCRKTGRLYPLRRKPVQGAHRGNGQPAPAQHHGMVSGRSGFTPPDAVSLARRNPHPSSSRWSTALHRAGQAGGRPCPAYSQFARARTSLPAPTADPYHAISSTRSGSYGLPRPSRRPDPINQ